MLRCKVAAAAVCMCAPVLSLLSTSIWNRGCVLRLMRNKEPSMFLRCCRNTWSSGKQQQHW